jgi:hypothetical protein
LEISSKEELKIMNDDDGNEMSQMKVKNEERSKRERGGVYRKKNENGVC